MIRQFVLIEENRLNKRTFNPTPPMFITAFYLNKKRPIENFESATLALDNLAPSLPIEFKGVYKNQ